MNTELKIMKLKIRIALLEGRGGSDAILKKLKRQLRAYEA